MNYLKYMLSCALMGVSVVCAFETKMTDAQIKDLMEQADRPTLGAHQHAYEHKTALVFGDLADPSRTMLVPDAVEQYARQTYASLNEGHHFNTKFIANSAAVREYYTDPKTPAKYQGKRVYVTREDGRHVRATYLDRGSKKVIVVFPGFTNDGEKMWPFGHMFDEYDVVIMDFSGHGYEPVSWRRPSSWFTFDLARNTFGMDSRESTLGETEDLDVKAIVQGLRDFGRYDAVYGVSLCFGSFACLKAQALNPGLFDKIVVDGCWNSLPELLVKFRKDAKLLCKPQTGGFSEYWASKQVWIQEILMVLAKRVWGLNIDHRVFLHEYLPLIVDTPVLFWYGKDDLVVYRREFERMFPALATPNKIAVITSNPHVINHLKQKELYKLICETFFNAEKGTESDQLARLICAGEIVSQPEAVYTQTGNVEPAALMADVASAITAS
jgi:pimeloyl-ACP methyl ester carboxylesterase